MDKKPCNNSIDVEVRKGPWTMEEDLILINYIANHGEGCVWNSLARYAGLKRTGKSCRLRWLNYLRPDVRRGNITPEEQLLIMELHEKWGNRWSKIAKYLPGRTDNEIKNFWRTRIQKHMKQVDQSTDFNITINPELQNNINININDQYQASSSSNNQINSSSFSPADHTIESYSPVVHAPSPFNNGNMEITNTTTTFQSAGSHIPTEESNENYWSMEDLWSMQFNGD